MSILTATASARFIISAAALLKATQNAQLLAKASPVVPILDCLLLEIEPAKTKYSTVRGLRITSSDLEHRFTSRPLPIECAGDMEPAAICVPGKQLSDLLRNIADQPLTIKLDPADEEASWPRLQLLAELTHSLLPSGRGQARYELAGEDSKEYPHTATLGVPTTTLHVPGHILLAGLAATLPVVSTDELRPAMCGVLVQAESHRLRMVSTNGHRLVRFTREDQHTQQGSNCNFIIPSRAAHLLSKLVDRRETVEMRVCGTQLLVTLEKGELQIRLTDEKYPDYEGVLPVELPNVLTAHRLELLAGVKRCALFANKTMHQLVFKLEQEGKSELVAEDRDYQNKASETLPGTYEGESIKIGVNAVFLQSFLERMSCQNVRIEMSTPNRAILMMSADADDGLLCLLMPVMINDYN